MMYYPGYLSIEYIPVFLEGTSDSSGLNMRSSQRNELAAIWLDFDDNSYSFKVTVQQNIKERKIYMNFKENSGEGPFW